MTHPVTPLEFWAKVDNTAGPDECWPWTAARMGNGYGRLNVKGRNVRTHRRAYELTYWPIPDGLLVCHRCDNPPCCNPAHLYAGTVGDNIRDAAARGRLWVQTTEASHARRGERNGMSKLTEGRVRQARVLASAGCSVRVIAATVHVSEGTIKKVLGGKAWAHVV